MINRSLRPTKEQLELLRGVDDNLIGYDEHDALTALLDAYECAEGAIEKLEPFEWIDAEHFACRLCGVQATTDNLPYPGSRLLRHDVDCWFAEEEK